MKQQKSGENRSQYVRKIALAGLLFALALVLSLVERSLPPIFTSIPGVKFGLSNIVVMYALFFVGKRWAFALAVLKAGFVALIAAPISGFVSLCGGLASMVVMSLLMVIFRTKISYMVVSVFGAVSHNVGQVGAVSLMYWGIYSWWVYLPVLLLSGVIAGLITAFLLKMLLPVLKKLGIHTALEE